MLVDAGGSSPRRPLREDGARERVLGVPLDAEREPEDLVRREAVANG